MRIHLRGLFKNIFLLFFAILLSQCQQKNEADYIFKAGLLVNEEHTWFKAFVHFKEEVEKKSNGRIQVEVYPSEQLGKEIEAIRLIQAGVIDMTITSSTLSNWTEILTFCELPFFLKDSTDMTRFMLSSTGKKLERSMIEDTGLRALGYFQRGERHLTSNRPIKHPDDLNGLIIRVPNVPSFVTAWSSLGAKPTPMSFSEVFTSLQQGTIEAQENPFAMIKNAGFAEVQKYINLTGHVYSWAYPVLGESQFQSLPKDLQKIVVDAGKEMQRYEHRLFVENSKIIQAELKAAGMEFIEVDKQAFVDKSEQAIYKSLSKDMQLIYKQVKEELR